MSTFQKQASAIQREDDSNTASAFSAKWSRAHSFAMTGRTGKRVQREDDPVPFVATDDAIRFRIAVVPDCRNTRDALGAVS